MTVRMKFSLLMGAFVCANVAIWGAHQIVSGLYDPILKALGS